MRIKDKAVFLSGPMSDDPENYHLDTFVLAHNKVARLGARKVYDPALYHLENDGEIVKPMRHEDYMIRCIHELTTRCIPLTRELVGETKYDVVVQLPGWEKSPGAMMEYKVARECGIPCIELDDCE